MDLTLDVEDYKLNLRAAGVIIHNNKILVHKNVNKDHYCLPGGRIAIGESSKQAVEREIKEELNKDVQINRFLAVVENFFEMNQSKYHEIFFLFETEFKDKEDKSIEHTLYNAEGKDYLQYEWLELDKLDNYNIVPNCMKKVFKEKSFPVHIINNELE